MVPADRRRPPEIVVRGELDPSLIVTLRWGLDARDGGLRDVDGKRAGPSRPC